MINHQQIRAQYFRLPTLLLLVAVTGCVSSPLASVGQSTNQAELSQPPSEPSYDPVLREQAVAEMRAKAEDTSGEKTNAFRTDDDTLEPMAPRAATRAIRRMDAKARVHSSRISDRELESKQKSIERMRKKLATHYDRTVKRIEN